MKAKKEKAVYYKGPRWPLDGIPFELLGEWITDKAIDVIWLANHLDMRADELEEAVLRRGPIRSDKYNDLLNAYDIYGRMAGLI